MKMSVYQKLIQFWKMITNSNWLHWFQLIVFNIYCWIISYQLPIHLCRYVRRYCTSKLVVLALFGHFFCFAEKNSHRISKRSIRENDSGEENLLNSIKMVFECNALGDNARFFPLELLTTIVVETFIFVPLEKSGFPQIALPNHIVWF